MQSFVIGYCIVPVFFLHKIFIFNVTLTRQGDLTAIFTTHFKLKKTADAYW